MAEDPYRTLGVTKDSTDAEIKRAYRKLARQYHPDRNPNDTASEERFKSIQNAYDMIGSSESRREWDQQKRMENMFSAGPGFSGSRSGFDFSDIFSQFMGGRGGSDFGFDSRAGRARHSQSSPSASPRGADIEAGLDVTLEEAASGTEKNSPTGDSRGAKNVTEIVLVRPEPAPSAMVPEFRPKVVRLA